MKPILRCTLLLSTLALATGVDESLSSTCGSLPKDATERERRECSAVQSEDGWKLLTDHSVAFRGQGSASRIRDADHYESSMREMAEGLATLSPAAWAMRGGSGFGAAHSEAMREIFQELSGDFDEVFMAEPKTIAPAELARISKALEQEEARLAQRSRDLVRKAGTFGKDPGDPRSESMVRVVQRVERTWGQARRAAALIIKSQGRTVPPSMLKLVRNHGHRLDWTLRKLPELSR